MVDQGKPRSKNPFEFTRGVVKNRKSVLWPPRVHTGGQQKEPTSPSRKKRSLVISEKTKEKTKLDNRSIKIGMRQTPAKEKKP